MGLTGNFGTGKSTVARYFRKMGARVLNADRLAHEVFQKKNPIYPRIRSLFPELKGRLNRTDVARIVFQDARKRRALESLIHPYVFDRILAHIQQGRERVVILEIPLLFESGFDRECDYTVVVRTTAKEVFRRLQEKGFQKAEVRARWRAQMPLQKKIKRSDSFIDNSRKRGETRRQVVRIWKKIESIERSLRKHDQRER